MQQINLLKARENDDSRRMQMIKVFLDSPLLNTGTSGGLDSYDWTIELPVIGSEFRVRVDAKGQIRSPGADFYILWHEYNGGSDNKKRDVLRRIEEYPAMRFTTYFKSHPITLAYLIGATQGLGAAIPEERINPFAAKEKDMRIPEKDLELALLSGALFSTMTEDEMHELFGQLEQLMRFGGGGFRAGALNKYISRFDGSMNHQKPKVSSILGGKMTHEEIIQSPRYKLYEDELFKKVIHYLDLNLRQEG
ncbi:hypothetical protein KY325_03805 [Candidatus Woesearchaeota archaeon]|nr:hypothetical protein [Candidatus Woesearchaeota archaeon]MBW3018258.1 hypothetical protein [Candidatus Woesearchaeota archaeon]